MRRRELLGLAAAAAGAGCADLPLGRRGAADSDGSAEARDALEVGPVDVQPSVIEGPSAFDVRGAPGGAFVRVPVRLGDGAPTPGPRTDERLLGGLAVDLDGRTFEGTVVDRAGGGWDRVLAVEVPSGDYEDGAVRMDAGRGDPIRRTLAADALDALADPPAFAVADFVVSDPIELMFMVATITVENVGGAAGRFLAGLGPVEGATPVVVAVPVRAGERVTQTQNLTLRGMTGPVTIRLQWDRGSVDRTASNPSGTLAPPG